MAGNGLVIAVELWPLVSDVQPGIGPPLRDLQASVSCISHWPARSSRSRRIHKPAASRVANRFTMVDLDREVCIIGAGVAGLKSAQTLLTQGLPASKLVILEAQDRVGGRLHTDRTLSQIGLHYDLGALWFHDCHSNVLFQHFYSGRDTKEFDVLRDGHFDDKPLLLYDELGVIDLHSSNLDTITRDMEQFCQHYFLEHAESNDMLLKDIVGVYLDKYGALLSAEERKYARVTMRKYELWHGVAWDKLSARYAVLEHNGRDFYNTKGYDFLITWLVSDVAAECIRLSTAVTNINRDAAKSEDNDHGRRICVTTAAGDRVFCDYLVVTVPHSVLRLTASQSPQAIEWTPPLPVPMQEAIGKMHFGALGKVIFEFELVWWDALQDRFGILARADSESTLPPQSFAFPALVINCSRLHRLQRGSLLILTQSPLTEWVEENPKHAWDYFGPMLATIARPGSQAQAPINTITTNWTLNPYIRGSYGAALTGDDPVSAIAHLSGEVDGTGLSGSTVRFAGEHTTYEGEGCVHGAWLSGEREAKWIIARRLQDQK